MSQNNADLINRIERSKYAPLYHHLREQVGKEFHTTFEHLESILGFQLPNSAQRHTWFWKQENEPTRHVHCRAWREAGWKTTEVNLSNRTLTFTRIT